MKPLYTIYDVLVSSLDCCFLETFSLLWNPKEREREKGKKLKKKVKDKEVQSTVRGIVEEPMRNVKDKKRRSEE